MTTRAARPTLPVWAHLTIFTLCIVVPLWCLLGLVAWNAVRQARGDYQQQTMVVTRNLALELDRELASLGGLLRALATSPALQDGDLRRFHVQASQVAPEGGAIVLRDPARQQLVNTLFPFGTPLPVTTAPAVVAADECVFRTRATCVSDLYVGTTDRQPYVLLDAPVFRDGEVAYALNVAVRARHLATLIAPQRLPEGWAVSILDRADRIVARSADHDRFVGQLANAALRTGETADEGSVRTTNVAGVPVWGAYARLPGWGWRVAVGVPETVLGAPLRRSLVSLGIAGLLALGLSVAAALLYGRRLARPIQLLGRAAGQVGRVAALPRIHGAIREVDQVSASLSEANERLRASMAERDRAQAELRRLNDDLQARIEAEVAARQEAQVHAAHAQRMQALGQLAGGIAHDFNNVLQATIGCASAIDRRAADPEAVRRFANLILNASARGGAVTRRLLAFAQRGDLRAEPVEAAALLSGLEEILSHTLGAHIAIRVAVPPGLPPVLADRGQLETVLVNLATNARDAMAEGGTLTFSASGVTVATGAADAPPGLSPGRYVRLAVADTGTGMDAATLARATEPFFTTKGLGQGNGLGLAMAKGFAEQSGGALAIESAPPRGTTVSLWLPLASGNAGVAAADAGTRARPAGQRPHLLLVDDEPLVREVLATQLADEGYTVTPASSGAEALALVARLGPPDAMVTDLNMPRMSGVELIRRMRSDGTAIPTILLTGNAQEGAALALEGALTQSFSMMRKPVLGAELADRLVSLTAVA